jgi:hypothetical protein
MQNNSHHRIGMAVGHDFLMGRFTFSQHIGVYLFKQAPMYDDVYQRYTLTYQLNKKWNIGVSLKAHRHVANFFDLRIGFRFI